MSPRSAERMAHLRAHFVESRAGYPHGFAGQARPHTSPHGMGRAIDVGGPVLREREREIVADVVRVMTSPLGDALLTLARPTPNEPTPADLVRRIVAELDKAAAMQDFAEGALGVRLTPWQRRMVHAFHVGVTR